MLLIDEVGLQPRALETPGPEVREPVFANADLPEQIPLGVREAVPGRIPSWARAGRRG